MAELQYLLTNYISRHLQVSILVFFASNLVGNSGSLAKSEFAFAF